MLITILLVALGATLTGMLATLWILSKLLAPFTLTADAIHTYKNEKKLPELPTHFKDEAGSLMANVQSYPVEIDELLTLKNDLISIISHDARSPANSILLAQEFIDHELNGDVVDKEEIRQFTDIIRKSTNRQLELMNNILTFTRLDTKNANITKEAVSLGQIVHNVHDANELHLQNKNHNFGVDLGNLTDATIMVDEAKFKSTLNNLVQNAIKFTVNNGNITITAKSTDERVVVKVSDDAIGIPAEKIPVLFERGSESHQPGTQNEKGLGLGLWICKVFTELNGGSIGVNSEVGKGTTLTLTFYKNEILLN